MDYELKKQYIENTLKETPNIIKNKIYKNNKPLNKKTEYYYFKKEIDNFLKEKTDDRFFIMTGLRGVGKTTILYQLYDYLINEYKITNERILYLDVDRLKNNGLFKLIDYIDIFIKDINEKNHLNNNPLFLFVDETQYAKNWDLTGKIIFDETDNVFTIFTGSDALNLEYSNESSRRSLKKKIYPLNFSQYLNLKYNYNFPEDLSEKFYNLLFTGETKELESIEKEIKNNIFLKMKRKIKKEWEDYIQFGNFPSTINKDKNKAIEITVDMKNRIIEKDLDNISQIKSSTKLISYPLLNIIAMSKPGELPLSNLSDVLNIPKSSVKNLINIFEKTQTIFHIDAYGSPTKRTRKSREYYFLSTQMKACLYLDGGIISKDIKVYLGILLENLVASTLYRLKENKIGNFWIFYDPRDKGVDFLIKSINGDIIPIEVGIGKKNNKQIKSAINKYKSEYGIIISNKKSSITKEDNIIHIPYTTFSLF